MTPSEVDFQLYEFGLPPPDVVGRINGQDGIVAEDAALRSAFDARYPDVYILAAWHESGRKLTLMDRVQSRSYRVRAGDMLIYTPTRPAKGPGSIDLSFGTPFSMLCSGFFYSEPHSPASERWAKQHLAAIASMTGVEIYVHPGYSDC